MRKIWILFCVLAVACVARENPFESFGELNSSVMTSNEKEKFGEFSGQDINFPKDTNVLLGITIKYRADDGSIKEKVIPDINKTINKTQEYVLMPENSKLDVSVTKPVEQTLNLQTKSAKVAQSAEIPASTQLDFNTQNGKFLASAPSDNQPQSILDKELKMKPVAINDANAALPEEKPASRQPDANQSQEEQKPVQISIREALARSEQSQNTAAKPAKMASKKSTFDVRLAPTTRSKKPSNLGKNLRFEVGENRLKIITKDQNIKQIMAYEKNKIVLDFAASAVAFDTKSVSFKTPPFRGATIGWHKGYYRVVIALDKARGYDLRKTSDGYEIGLR